MQTDVYHSGYTCPSIHGHLAEDELRYAVVLILANKKDINGAMSLDEICEILEANKIRKK